MKRRIYNKYIFSLTCVFVFIPPSNAFADASDWEKSVSHPPHHSARHVETNISAEIFAIGDSKLNNGNTQVGTSGVAIEGEYEKNEMSISYGYEQWNYNWANSEAAPFISGTNRVPWSTFNVLQFGIGYEQEKGDWELNYFFDVESSFEKEMSGSREYEMGVDITYEPSLEWSYTFSISSEYQDAPGGELELGVGLEIEWNHDKKDGWSGEAELDDEFPEINMSYHFTRQVSTTLFYNEGGTNAVRLSDNSPVAVAGMQGGYVEDSYKEFGAGIRFEFSHESYVSFSLQKITGRAITFEDGLGNETGSTYRFEDAVQARFGLSYTF